MQCDVDRTGKLLVARQGRVLDMARSTAYYQPVPVPPEELALTRRIDELHLNFSFDGARILSKMLKREGKSAERCHMPTLMARMGIDALYRKLGTSKRHPAHPAYPYLLRNLAITRSNHVWVAGITYIPMKREFVYLFAVIDWASRWVLSWRPSNKLTTNFCKEVVQEAINRYGKPEIFNTNHGCQFTSLDFTGLLKDNGIQISMDGKGCWRDNVFVERLWRRVKYEGIYLYAYGIVNDAKRGLGKHARLYNQDRPHTALDDKTSDEFYYDNLPALQKAA